MSENCSLNHRLWSLNPVSAKYATGPIASSLVMPAISPPFLNVAVRRLHRSEGVLQTANLNRSTPALIVALAPRPIEYVFAEVFGYRPMHMTDYTIPVTGLAIFHVLDAYFPHAVGIGVLLHQLVAVDQLRYGLESRVHVVGVEVEFVAESMCGGEYLVFGCFPVPFIFARVLGFLCALARSGSALHASNDVKIELFAVFVFYTRRCISILGCSVPVMNTVGQVGYLLLRSKMVGYAIAGMI